MEKVCQLVETALEQVAWAHHQGMIPRALSHHSSADSVKRCSHDGDYDDQGNWLGSVTMLILLFPETYYPKYDARWVCPGLITYLNGAGDRREPLMYISKSHQVSGKGVNNYRTNLLEGLLTELGEYVSALQDLWNAVLAHYLDRRSQRQSQPQRLDDRLLIGVDCQVTFIMDFFSNRNVTTSCLLSSQPSPCDVAMRLCKEHDLDVSHYFEHLRSFAGQLQKMPDMRLPASYSELMKVVACTKNKARNMWYAIEQVPEMMRVPSGNF